MMTICCRRTVCSDAMRSHGCCAYLNAARDWGLPPGLRLCKEILSCRAAVGWTGAVDIDDADTSALLDAWSSPWHCDGHDGGSDTG